MNLSTNFDTNIISSVVFYYPHLCYLYFLRRFSEFLSSPRQESFPRSTMWSHVMFLDDLFSFVMAVCRFQFFCIHNRHFKFVPENMVGFISRLGCQSQSLKSSTINSIRYSVLSVVYWLFRLKIGSGQFKCHPSLLHLLSHKFPKVWSSYMLNNRVHWVPYP